MNRKILIVDDSKSIHEDFRKILCKKSKSSFEDLDTFIFGRDEKECDLSVHFELESALQGQEANRMVIQSITNNSPYAMAFVDMRMPPGWGGIETVKHLWQSDPDLEIVICSAYSDYSWKDIMDQLGGTDKLLFLKKPFDNIEIRQLAFSLTEKWNLKKQASLKLSDLENLVAERTEQLYLANEARVEFFANMSHEIRTPISGILGMLELISSSQLNQRQMSSINLAKLSATSLFALINDVLDYSKIQSNNLCLESIEFSMFSIIEEVAQMYSVLGEKNGISVYCKQDFSLPNSLIGDPTRIRQVIINLVGNALKFTPDGYIYIKCKELLRDGDLVKVRFSVEDTGVGIEESKTKSIFGKFQQASDAISGKFGGTGLGLSISQELIELMGGKINVESSYGIGSEFYFELDLPYNCVGSQASLIETREVEVFVEDDLQRDILCSYLESFDATYRVLSSLEEVKSSDCSGILFSDYYNQDTIADKYQDIFYLIDISNPVLLENDLQDIQCLTLPFKRDDLLKALNGEWGNQKPLEISAKDSQAYSILVVEDTLVNQQYVSFVLSKLSCKVDIAENGNIAIEKLKSGNRYDLIFMDCNLPILNGFDTATIIRKEKLVPDEVAIVAMTANETVDDRRHCKEVGMNDFVTKPFNVERVKYILQKYISSDLINNKSGDFIIVDSDRVSSKSKIESIKRLFSTGNIELLSNGLEACSFIRKQTPDVIVLELDLDLVSGIDVLKLIAKNTSFESTKVIVSTSRNEEDDLVKEAKQIRSLYYHHKSSDFEEVLNKM